MNDTLILMSALILKHFLVDFPMQNKFQWSNKGTYGHPGGLIHAGLHASGTLICFLMYAPFVTAYWLALIDGVVHYHIDWAKMNLNARMGWGPNTHEQFWWLLGLDQFLHYATYIGLVCLVT